MPIQVPKQASEQDRQMIRELLREICTDDPSLEQIWSCMDSVWDVLGCDNMNLDTETLNTYYRHPVWLLNGLFIEQHLLSLEHRDKFSDWVMRKKPRRVADFGGGYGTLARMIAGKCLSAEVHVIEPHPHPLAIERSATHNNLLYQSWFNGTYDIIIATDVFEHVPDPLLEVEKSGAYLEHNGFYLIANNFHPVIKCHLPSTFHFRNSWNLALKAMNLKRTEAVVYGVAYQKTGDIRANAARSIEMISKARYFFTEAVRAVRSKLIRQLQ